MAAPWAPAGKGVSPLCEGLASDGVSGADKVRCDAERGGRNAA